MAAAGMRRELSQRARFEIGNIGRQRQCGGEARVLGGDRRARDVRAGDRGALAPSATTDSVDGSVMELFLAGRSPAVILASR